MTEEFKRFVAMLSISDRLLDQSSKEQVADVARVLALNVAQYRAQFREIPISESLTQLIHTQELEDNQAKALGDGFEVLVSAIKAMATPTGEHEVTKP